MTDQKYKQLNITFISALIIFFIAFFADIYLIFIMDNFQPDFIFAVITIIAALSYLMFMRYLLWTFFNVEGKAYWRKFIEKNKLQSKEIFKAKEPADVIRTWILAVVAAAVAIILIIVF